MVGVGMSDQDMPDATHVLGGESEGEAAGVDGKGIIHHKRGKKLALRIGGGGAG